MSLWSKAREAMKRPGGSGKEPASAHCGDHGSVKFQAGTPEFELAVAENELKAGNLAHGAHHLAQLISYDPSRREWLELLEEYLRRVDGDVAKLHPIKEKRYFAEEAVRAYAWARQGQVKEALELLLQVVNAKPDSIYLEAWALDWLAKDETLAAIPPKAIAHLLAQGVTRFPEARWLNRRQRAQLQRYAELAARVPEALRSSPELQMMHAGTLRKLGRFDEALAVAQDMTFTSPGWHSHVARGLALRERGDFEEAAAAFEQALTHDPDDLAARLEAADGYLTHRVWDKAHAWYGQVLQQKPEHPWALASALFCGWKSNGDAEKHRRLMQLARANPPNQRAVQLLRLNEPYVGILPRPADATANALRKITKAFRERPPEPGGDLTLNVSHLESPSATLAIEEQLKALGCSMPVIIHVKAIATPDPRQPCRPVTHLLWKYDGDRAAPGLPPPPPAIHQVVAALAAQPFDRDRNWTAAEEAARGLQEADIPQLLAAMVNPPPVPAGKDALDWLPRVQLAAAQLIAHVGADWPGSARRDALLSVLFGPRDWTTVAALITLAHLAEANAAIAPDVNEAFTTLAGVIPEGGYCCFLHALYACWLWLPNLPAEERRRLQEQLIDLEGG